MEIDSETNQSKARPCLSPRPPARLLRHLAGDIGGAAAGWLRRRRLPANALRELQDWHLFCPIAVSRARGRRGEVEMSLWAAGSEALVSSHGPAERP